MTKLQVSSVFILLLVVVSTIAYINALFGDLYITTIFSLPFVIVEVLGAIFIKN